MAKVSVCVLTYGDYLELAQRCLGSIIQFFPREQYRLLVGANAVSPRMAQYLDDLKKSGAIDSLMVSEININKCPMMRRLFEHVETEFIWWFDDDSWVKGPAAFAHWLKAAQTAPASTAVWGHVFFYSNDTDFSRARDMVQWVRDARWFTGMEPPSWKIGGKGVTEFKGKPSGDGRWFFPTGGCWLARKSALDRLDWPDPRLVKAADDVLLAEAIRQQGWKVADLHSFEVMINDHERRGQPGTEPAMQQPPDAPGTSPALRPAKSKPVEVVIVNWRRPNNVKRIVRAFAAQKEHCSITLIESAADTIFALDAETLRLANRRFVFSHNFGSFNRFVPLLGYEAEFTLFHDDDLLPGPGAVVHLLKAARENPKFAVLGEFGRAVSEEGKELTRDARRFQSGCRRVDFLVRSYFVRTSHLRHFVARCVDLGVERQHCEDDLLLCSSLQQMTGWPCLVTPRGSRHDSLASEHLPEPFALWHRPEHFKKREQFIEQLMASGWAPLRTSRARRRGLMDSPALIGNDPL